MDDPTLTQPLPTTADAPLVQPLLPTGETPEKQPFPWKSALLIIGTLALTISLAFVPVDVMERLGNYGYLGVFVLTLLSSATLVLPSPAVGVALLAGKTLNPWLVGVLAGSAAGLGEITGYLAGMGGSEFAKRSRFYPPIERFVKRWGMLTIFVMSIIPSPLFDIAGIAAGTVRMPFWRFLLACLAGKTLRFIGLAWAGRIFLGG